VKRSLRPRRLRLTAAAERDLDDTAAWLAREAGLRIADRSAERMDKALTRLAGLGHAGVGRDWLAPGLRMHPVDAYAVYFRIDGADMTVLRVLHGRMDVAAARFDARE